MRNISDLHPRLQSKLAELQTLCSNNGITIKIGECLRTVAEQDALYAKGRTTAGNIVTNAKGSSYSSQHQWGIAADFYLDMDIDGDGSKSDDAFNNATRLFDSVGSLAKSIGLGWGGDWKSPVDKPHLYLPDWGSTPSKLKAQYGTPENFFRTWSNTSTTAPSSNTNNTQTSSGNSIIAIGQAHANNFAQCGLVTDGIRGANTRKAAVKVVQRALNADYNAGLVEDGIWGNATERAFGKHYVTVGEIQYLVCALEILCMLKGKDPKGVECPGKFGNGLASACGTRKAYKDTFKNLTL